MVAHSRRTGTGSCLPGWHSAGVAEATDRIGDFSSSLHHLLYRSDEGLPARLPFGEGTQVLALANPTVHTVHRKAVFPELMARRMLVPRAISPRNAEADIQCRSD